MDKIIVHGGSKLSGCVRISGSKNSALPILAATLLTKEPCVISRVPDLSDIHYMLRELIALDQAVASAVSFAGAGSLILVVGKQSVGGLRLNGYPFRDDKGVSVVGINSQGIPSMT